MLTANDVRVQRFFKFIEGKAKNSSGHILGNPNNESGLLYVISGKVPGIQIWLPTDLLEYANAAAGTSGNRAVGIRKIGFDSVERAAEEIARIFSSAEELANFINLSEQNYQIPDRSSSKTKVRIAPAAGAAHQHQDLPAKTLFWKRWGKDTLQHLKDKFGKPIVQEAYQHLTMFEFELRFGLTKGKETI